MALTASQQLDAALAQMTTAVDAAKTELATSNPIKWGFNASSLFQYQKQLAVFGQPNIVRYYHQVGEKVLPPTDIPRGDFSWIISGKASPAEVAAGKADADLTTLAQWMHRDDKYCPWHEPEDNIETGYFTLAEYQAMWDHVSALFRSVNPNAGLTCILMGYTFAGGKNRVWQNYIPKDFDTLGVDQYALGSIGVTAANIPTMFDASKNAAATLGKPLDICEVGVGKNPSPIARTDAIQKVAATAKASGAKSVCYFTPGINNQWTLDTPAEQFAWKSGQNA